MPFAQTIKAQFFSPSLSLVEDEKQLFFFFLLLLSLSLSLSLSPFMGEFVLAAAQGSGCRCNFFLAQTFSWIAGERGEWKRSFCLEGGWGGGDSFWSINSGLSDGEKIPFFFRKGCWSHLSELILEIFIVDFSPLPRCSSYSQNIDDICGKSTTVFKTTWNIGKLARFFWNISLATA